MVHKTETVDIATRRFIAFLVDLLNHGFEDHGPYSQEELAKKLGLSQSQLNNYLKGVTKKVTSKPILEAVRWFGVNPWYFFGTYKSDRYWRDVKEFISDPVEDPHTEAMMRVCDDFIDKITTLKAKRHQKSENLNTEKKRVI